MKIGVIYARYSSDRQNEQSIEGQMRVCEDFAAKNGIEIVERYIDRAMSGTNDNREDFQKMLKDSDNKEWDVVLVYKLDRFSRNKYEMAIHRKHLKDNGVKIVSAMENIPDSPEGILLESLLEGMNQYYSEELSQKTKRGKNETRLKGNFFGGNLNYGYSLTPVYTDNNGKKVLTAKKVIINEEEAPIVNEIFTAYINGTNPIDIARGLNKRGILHRGKEFKDFHIYYILRSEQYTGIYRFNNCVYDKIYPPILPIETYNIVRAKIDANKYGKHTKDSTCYMIKDKAFCGYCGRRITSFAGTSKSGKIYRYYTCVDSRNCKQNRRVRKEVLEQAITNALQKILSSENNFNLLVTKILETFNSRLYDTSSFKIAEKEFQRVENSLANLITAVENGFYSESSKTRLQELEKRKTELKNAIALERNKVIEPLTKEQVADYMSNAINQPLRTMIDLLVRKVIIKDNNIDVYLKNTNDDLPDDKDKNKRKKQNSPERNLSERGCLFMEYSYGYKINTKGFKPRGYDKSYNNMMFLYLRVLV